MTGRIKLLTKKIEARIANGEALDDIIASYPFLTQLEIEKIKEMMT